VAVVHDAGALTDDVMHAFARETRLSETSFVQPAEAEGADYRHRIWTMDGEIPFAGHPSLGTAVAVARAGGSGSTSLVQQTRPGLQRIDVELGDSAAARASMLQEPPSFGPELDPDVLLFVGLTPEDADPELPPQVVSTGVPQVLVPVRDAEALAGARPDYEAIEPLLVEHGAIVYYLVHVQAGGRIRARSFMRTAEMGEDPATGSAVGPLCAYVAERGGPARIEIDQGAEIGRASRLHAMIDGDRVRVEGDVVAILDGTLELDF
jgi:trans-2,3-dihydro-3-hydroxyanthranilate isomerase